MSELPVQPPAAQPPQEDPSVWAALQLAWELGYMIALPAVVLGFSGAYIDKQQNSSPLFLTLGFIVAFTVSFISVTRKVRQITPK